MGSQHFINWKKYSQYSAHIILSLFFIFPVYWALITSFKSSKEMALYPPTFFPNNIDLSAYKKIITYNDGLFVTMFYNSVLVTLSTALIVCIISTLAGYSFANFKFRGKEIIFVLILSTILIPFQGLLIPLFDLMASFGLTNTRIGLIIIYVTFQLPFGIFMMRNAFESLPTSLRESSFVDGASETRTVIKVLIPLTLPGLLTTIIYSIYNTWNDYLIALVFNTRGKVSLLTVGLQQLSTGSFGTDWSSLMSGSVISFLPIVILYAFLQKYFIRGLVSSAVKE